MRFSAGFLSMIAAGTLGLAIPAAPSGTESFTPPAGFLPGVATEDTGSGGASERKMAPGEPLWWRHASLPGSNRDKTIEVITAKGDRFAATLDTIGTGSKGSTDSGSDCPQNIDVPNIEDPASMPAPPANGRNARPLPLPVGPGGISGPAAFPRSGAAADNGNPLSDPGNSIVSTALQSANAAEAARGLEMLNAGIEARNMITTAAKDDQQTLSETYRRMPLNEFGDSLNRAYQSLTETADFLDSSPSGLERSESLRFRNLFLNARDKAALGIDALQQSSDPNSLGKSPFSGLHQPGGRNPLSKTQALQDIFGTGSPRDIALTQDGLVDRLMMFNGLSDAEKASAAQRLKLAETLPLKLANGVARKITLLHNGYILGGSKSAMDCSSFVSSLLPSDARQGRLTTLDLRAMWIYRRTGKLHLPPVYTPPRARDIKKAADAFVPIDVYEGSKLQPGDLLVYRVPWETTGHVFLVKSHNPANHHAEVVEAAQSAGTVREREFALSTSPVDAKNRPLRPGLFALRLKPSSNQACSYKDKTQGGAR